MCLFSRVTYGAPSAPFMGQIMGRHLDARNTRSQRITYADLPTIERDLMAHRVPQANTLLADTLCTIIGWATFLSTPERNKLRQIVGIPVAPTPSVDTENDAQRLHTETQVQQVHAIGHPPLPKSEKGLAAKEKYASPTHLRPRSRAK